MLCISKRLLVITATEFLRWLFDLLDSVSSSTSPSHWNCFWQNQRKLPSHFSEAYFNLTSFLKIISFVSSYCCTFKQFSFTGFNKKTSIKNPLKKKKKKTSEILSALISILVKSVYEFERGRGEHSKRQKEVESEFYQNITSMFEILK